MEVQVVVPLSWALNLKTSGPVMDWDWGLKELPKILEKRRTKLPKNY
jgi:hypothetical protein